MANEYIRASLASNTRKAYLHDLAHFEKWGGAIPASPECVARYLAQHAGQLAVATLVRRVASISKAHEARSLPNPCRAEIVKATLRGVKRRWGCAQDQAKALVREDLFQVLDAMGAGIKDARDRALLLIGFAGGFRRSELVALDCADVENVRQGLWSRSAGRKWIRRAKAVGSGCHTAETATAPCWRSNAGGRFPASGRARYFVRSISMAMLLKSAYRATR